MKPALPVQILEARSGQMIEELHLDWTPHPGQHLEIQEQFYVVLEKRHYYQLRQGRYQLQAIRAFVQVLPGAEQPTHGDRHLVAGRWVIGDLSCRWNAHSPLLRCAVRPLGPCEGCPDYDEIAPEL